MNLQLKRISYKVLIISMITVILSFFTASSVSEAKLKLKEGEFYYSGTQEAEYSPEAGFWDNILGALAEIANYLFGIMTLGVRGVVVGLIEIMEIILTLLLDPSQDMLKIIADCFTKMDGYTQDVVNVEKIIFNEVKLLDANIFK